MYPRGFACACTDEAFGCDSKCFMPAMNVGDFCESTNQCELNPGEFADCLSERCTCKPGSMPNSEKNKCIPTMGSTKIGKPCVNSNECAGDPSYNSICSLAGICICRSGFISSSSMEDCLPVIDHLGEPCA